MVFSEKLNGALVNAAPNWRPSTLNCTLVVLDETFVEIVMVPETVAPDAGDVIEIVGGGLPPLPTPNRRRAGKDVLLVKGEAITQVFGCGGICGGGNLCAAGDSACCRCRVESVIGQGDRITAAAIPKAIGAAVVRNARSQYCSTPGRARRRVGRQ